MTKNPPFVKVGDRFEKVINIFKKTKINSVQVLNGNGEIQGIISQYHAFKLLSDGTPQETPVEDIMEENIKTIGPNVSVEELIKWNVSSLPVVENKKLLGLINLSDTIKAYNASMLELQRELSAVVKAVYNGIISVDSNKQIKFINKSAEEAFGIDLNELKGVDIDKIIEANLISEVVETGRQVVNRRIEYGNKAFMTNCSCIRDDAGSIIGAVCSFQDSTGLEETYRELLHTKEMTEELNAIFESSFDGILVTDNEGVIKKVNSSFREIIKCKTDLTGKRIDILEDVIDIDFFYILKEQKSTITTSCVLKEGGELLISANPVMGNGGAVEGMVANVRDITSLKLLENQVAALKELYKNELAKANAMKMFVFESTASKNVVELALRVAKVESTVLITGESGVGKEVVANLIHSNSSRKNMPFVKINCGAIPESLLESELFGYEAGAFTGAQRKGKPGIFEIASRGVLLLDEVGDLPLHLQVKLLRAIQEKEIMRIGGVKPVKIDVRIIAATNKDLKKMMEAGEFRKDLYYRLNVVPIHVPPLRERPEDLIALSKYYLNKINEKYGMQKQLGQAAMESIYLYEWPGNVRELENIIERAAVTTQGDTIENLGIPASDRLNGDSMLIRENIDKNYKEMVQSYERKIISYALEKYRTTRKAGEALGLDQSTIVKKAIKLGIQIK
jgi:PAS domain S-box-containing protein